MTSLDLDAARTATADRAPPKARAIAPPAAAAATGIAPIASCHLKGTLPSREEMLRPRLQHPERPIEILAEVPVLLPQPPEQLVVLTELPTGAHLHEALRRRGAGRLPGEVAVLLGLVVDLPGGLAGGAGLRRLRTRQLPLRARGRTRGALHVAGALGEAFGLPGGLGLRARSTLGGLLGAPPELADAVAGFAVLLAEVVGLARGSFEVADVGGDVGDEPLDDVGQVSGHGRPPRTPSR